MSDHMTVNSSDAARERLCAALCTLRTPAEASQLLRDLCTTREISELAQRLEVAVLLEAGSSYLEVSAATGASSTTVSRVSKCLKSPTGGYRLVLDRLADEGSARE